MTQIAIIRAVGGLTFDATFEESHQSDLEVTDNPVESGVTISDHAYMKPQRLTISAGVSNSPIKVSANDPFAADYGRHVKAYELLQELQRNAEPFDVQTGLKLYSNMICSSLTPAQDKDTPSVLVFTAALREVLIVNTQTTTYAPRKAGATNRQASAKNKKGEQQTATTDETTKKKSLVARLKDAFTGK
jgi:hypothetical protein